MNDEEILERLASIKQSVPESFEIDLQKAFPKLEGMGWKSSVKQKVKLFHLVETQLQKTIKEGEEVLYIAKGVQQTNAEQFFLGVWAAMINQTVFVFTNLRLVMFNTDSEGAPKHTFWSIYYNEIVLFKGNMMGSASLKLADGKKFTYGGFKGVDRKQIPQVVEHARAEYQQLGFAPKSSQSRENLCCQCMEIVPALQYECQYCGQKFYTPKELALRSLVFPSWGDFCMKHTGLACMELLSYLVSWGIFISIFFGPKADGNVVVRVGFFLILLIIEHCVDATLTYYIAKKGLSPR